MKHLIAAALCFICAIPVMKNNYDVTFVKDGFFGCDLANRQFEVIIKSQDELSNFVDRILLDYSKSCIPQQNVAELSESVKDFYKKYDKDFFKSRYLVLAYIESGSGSLRFSVTGLELSGKTLLIKIARKIPLMVTMDYRQWFMMLEVDKTLEADRAVLIFNDV